MSNLPTGNRQHQTALVIDIRDGASDKFVNRYQRLLESVNGDNIKADIYTLRGNSAGTGAGLVFGTPDNFQSPDSDEDEIDLSSWADSEGYNMLLVATPV